MFFILFNSLILVLSITKKKNMVSKLKRDQLPKEKAINWRKSFKEEEKLSFDLKVSHIVLQKATYSKLVGDNENRVRVYLGLEPEQKNGKHVLCAFAVSAFLLGSGDVYVDYETPVYKLTKQNEDYSGSIDEVTNSIKRYRSWRAGELDVKAQGAEVRKYIYPNAYLLTKYELHEIFNIQNKEESQIDFGISKTMSLMISPIVVEARAIEDASEVFDEADPCPPYCDDRSSYNT